MVAGRHIDPGADRQTRLRRGRSTGLERSRRCAAGRPPEGKARRPERGFPRTISSEHE
ncbi:hypothetical protein KI387_036714, partial [Taxus chinensis]